MLTKSISSSWPVYVPSGKFSGITYFILAISAVLVLPALSIIYSFITWYSPIIYLNLIVAIFTGVALGACIYPIVKYGKVRSYQHEILFIAVLWFFFLWSGWAVHLTLVTNITGESATGTSFTLSTYLFYISHPITLFHDIKILASVGLYEVFGAPVKGFVAYFVWFLEAAILFVAAFIFNKKWSVLPFSEVDNAWGVKQKLNKKLSLHRGIDKFAEALHNQEVQVFEHAPKTSGHNMEYTELVFFIFPKDDASYLAFYNMVVETDEKGKKKQKYFRNSDFYYVTPEMRTKLQEVFSGEEDK